MRVLKYVGIAVVVILIVIIAVPFFINANQFRPQLEGALSNALGRPVKIGDLNVRLWSGGVTAQNLEIGDDPAFSRNPFLQAKSLNLSVELMPLVFSHQLHVKGLIIDQPSVVLLQAPSGVWNFSSLGGKANSQAAPSSGGAAPPKPGGAAPPNSGKSAPSGGEDQTSSNQPLALSVNLVKITNGHLAVGQTNTKAKPVALDNVNLEVRDFAPDSSFPFSFSSQVAGGGQLSLEGKAGPIAKENVDQTPAQLTLHVAQLNLAGSGMVQPSTGIAGLVSFDAQGSSTGQVVDLNGRLTGEKLKFSKGGQPAPRPVSFNFEVAHDLRKKTGRLKRGDLSFGGAPASLTGTYDLHGETAAVNMSFIGQNMAIDQLKQFLPAFDVVLPAGSSLQGGGITAKMTMNGPLDRLVTSGPLAVNNTRMVGFDLGGKMKAIEALAGIGSDPNTLIQNLGADVKMSPMGTAVDNFQLNVPSIGQLTGSGTISPDHALDFKMTAAVHASGGAILASLGQNAKATIPFFITGTASNPVFRPDVKGLAKQKIQQLTGNSDLGKAADGVLNRILGGKKQK